ncbi:gamma-glutamylcyclotransferase family protein [Microbacterium ulmi]|uniref:Gamma-glutamylcyclotransferase n=1 Tax=Microbacterium ulmi TaxID=179095 RepID=A0A7Y2Q0Z9_9MICO|nr:gamma-glutamylcyclotransferase family protein [Microbacterium ulmi]NII68317.1 hypothetical protein [Microbacterium ulmi]NNH03148.1 gamma-glutamylcyclotransferase [Microbacterium ulmi]
MAEPPDQLLFSYGALQNPHLQLATFGRVVESEPDILPGYTADYVEVPDGRFTDLTGLTVHPQLRATGNARDKVIGRVLQLTEAELDAADQFEVSMYRRTPVTLASGRGAWVYVSA